MRSVSIEEFVDILECMTISHSVDSGFVITHFGEVGGRPTIAISNCNGDGNCFLMQ